MNWGEASEGPLSDGSHGAVSIVSELALELNRCDFIPLPQAEAAAQVPLTVCPPSK